MKRNALYMFLGGLLVFMGHVASSVFTQDAQGQAGAGAQHIDRLTCRAIDIIGDDGQKRISIASGEEGGIIALWGPDNSLATLITSDDKGGVISVRGTRDKSQVALQVTEAGSGLWLLGPDGGKRVAMDANALGGDLSLYDSAAKARATLLVLPEGVEFALRARDESKRAVVSVTPNDAGTVQTFHPEGPRSGSMPTF